MDKHVKALFDAYEKAFNALDGDAQAELFTETFISAGPHGTIAQDRGQFRKLSRQAADFYRRAGQTGVRAVRTRETPISDGYAIVTIHWAATFATLDRPVEFDVSYVVQKTDREAPRIIMFIAHQDEDEAMKQLGEAVKPAE